jgi:hypothetical protein
MGLNSKQLGLILRQEKQRALISEAGWFEPNGLMLGYGDVDIPDLERISRRLEIDQALVILSKEDWKGAIESRDPELLRVQIPAEIVQKTICIVFSGLICYLPREDQHEDQYEFLRNLGAFLATPQNVLSGLVRRLATQDYKRCLE